MHQTAALRFAWLAVLVGLTLAAPQGDLQAAEPPMPYEYNYQVDEPKDNLYYGAEERGNEAGRVEGSYYVWLADGRLMKVSYYVDGDSGFVPTITFMDRPLPAQPSNAL